MELIIHQIWVGPYQIPARELNFIEKVKKAHPTFEHRLWTDFNLPALPPFIEERFQWRMSIKDYAFAADILRVYLIWLFGGIYLDVDTDTKIGLTGLSVSSLDGIFRCNEPTDPSFSNDFMGLRKGSRLGWFMLQSMEKPAYVFGPHWLAYTIEDYLRLARESPHTLIRARLAEENVMLVPSNANNAEPLGMIAWNNRFQNCALASWSPENKKRFEDGTII